MKVKQIREKMYINQNQIPKSSPSQRNGIENMYYEIAHGKDALIDKVEK